jgi:glucoamylase
MRPMGWARMVLGLVAAIAAGALLLSGGSEADPQTPAGLRGMPPPFLGVAVLGDGGLTAAVDAYGNVVDLRAPGPAGVALIENPADRQVAGTVPADTGIQIWVGAEGGPPRPMWRADRVEQAYLRGTNVLRTVAWFGQARVGVEQAARGAVLAAVVSSGGGRAQIRVDADLPCRRERVEHVLAVVCAKESPGGRIVAAAEGTIRAAAAADREWLTRARQLAGAAPRWAERMYRRSLLVLRALTDRRNGAVAAGARDGWAYVWPRDAAAAAIAFAGAGYRPEAELVTRFLLGAGLDYSARFHGDGSPVPGRDAQGDEIGWTAAAAEASGIIGSRRHAVRILSGGEPVPWRDRADYWEGEPGDYLGNAIASVDGPKVRLYVGKSARRLVRRLKDPGSGLDSAAAWAVRPFRRPALFGAARRTMLQLAAEAGPYGLLPGQGWTGGPDPWSAPTAWTAWSLAALGERRQALELVQALRRSATPAGTLAERVDAETGVARSTTPLAWSHAFAILALRELWPRR